MLVSIVTPRSKGGRLLAATASRAARIISRSPSVHIDQADPGKIGGRGDSAADRVRNVVEFQVEEDIETKARELLNGSRTFGGE